MANQTVSKPQAEDVWANMWALSRKGSSVLPFIFLAAFLLWMMPFIMEQLLGFDPLQSSDTQWWIQLFALSFRVAGVVVIAASFPITRSLLVARENMPDEEEPKSDSDIIDSLFDHGSSAFPAALIFGLIVTLGILASPTLGLFAALFLAPSLYLITVQNRSLARAISSCPGQFATYPKLLFTGVSTIFSFYFCVAILAGFGFLPTGTLIIDSHHSVFATLMLQVLFTVPGSLLFIAFHYFLYTALAAAFITIDFHENDLPLRP